MAGSEEVQRVTLRVGEAVEVKWNPQLTDEDLLRLIRNPQAGFQTMLVKIALASIDLNDGSPASWQVQLFVFTRGANQEAHKV